MNAADYFAARGDGEEGVKLYAYDDATGKRVKAPVGNLTFGIGCNLEAITLDLVRVVFAYQVRKIDAALQAYYWYPKLDAVRQSVVLDVAFNCGLDSLLHFPKMIAALAVGNWTEAEKQLLDSDAARELPKRYGPGADPRLLCNILLTGVQNG